VDYALFYLQVAWACWTVPAPIGTVFLTTPPLLAVVGWIGRLLRGRAYGVWSMDLHPEAEIAAEMVRPRGLLAHTLRCLSDASYRQAEFVIDLGPCMRARIRAKGVPEDHLHTVPVWAAAPDAAGVAPDGRAVRARLGLEGKCVVMYAGNAGVVHDFADILEALRLLRDDAGVYWLFVGGGPRRATVEAFARTHAIPNFAYLPYAPRELLADTLAAADIHLASLRAPFAGIAVPGKVYGVMAAARPLIFVGPAASEPADAIRDARCGAVIDPSDGSAAERLVGTIRAWRDDPEAARAAGARGLAAYADRYRREPNCAAFARVLEAAWPRAFAGVAPEGVAPEGVAPEVEAGRAAATSPSMAAEAPGATGRAAASARDAVPVA
jgi:colanic acid biosynthesis glycosyl transferase WcaI